MKKLISFVLMVMTSVAMMAQAQIKFDSTTHNFGTFSESTPTQKCEFTFTNTGDQPLVINQQVAVVPCLLTPKHLSNQVRRALSLSHIMVRVSSRVISKRP